jgi:mersacidin/lichenicidin family type 2 lantibiotic
MTALETVKAWKDEDYRDTLKKTERQKLPAHPAGLIELETPRSDDEGRFLPLNRMSVGCFTLRGCITVKHCPP